MGFHFGNDKTQRRVLLEWNLKGPRTRKMLLSRDGDLALLEVDEAKSNFTIVIKYLRAPSAFGVRFSQQRGVARDGILL